MSRRTALYEEHLRLGGKVIDFGGWDLPVQYSGVIEEHENCRKTAGIFDVSHMGEVDVEGQEAEKYLNYLVTNDVAKLVVGQAQYTVMCSRLGGIIDDLVIYRRGVHRFLVVVNASNTEKDFQHMKKVGESFQVSVVNRSSEYTQIAVQGRYSEKIVSQITSTSLTHLKNYRFTEGFVLDEVPAIIARTGYTGEDGFEIYIPWEKGPEVWQFLLKIGMPIGLKPCGLGARDTLRMEMKYPLYGNELDDQTHPLEAGLGWIVSLDKSDFLGKDELLRIQKNGLTRKLVGLKLLQRGIPRHGYLLLSQNRLEGIGVITSGTLSPSLKQSIAIGYVNVENSGLGTQFNVDIRGSHILAEVVSTPFYKRPY